MIAELEKRIRRLIDDGSWQLLASGQCGSEHPLYLLTSATFPTDAPHLLVTAGVHGDEPAGTLALLDYLEQGRARSGIRWTVLPYLNPTGLLLGTRENSGGVDLNRDFRVVRTAEVAFYQRTIPAVGPYDLHLALHEDWEFTGSYLYEINTGIRPSMALPLVEVMERCTGLVDAPLIDDHVPTQPGLIIHHPEADEPENWPEAIYLVKQQPLLSYTVETPSSLPLARRIECHQAVLDRVSELVLD